MTKGYGFTVNDIDWSCPADLEPYAKAHNLEMREIDNFVHAACGIYMLSAVAVAVEKCLAGKKSKLEYVKDTITSGLFENEGLTEEEINQRELEKMIRAEEEWIRVSRMRGLPETKFSKK